MRSTFILYNPSGTLPALSRLPERLLNNRDEKHKMASIQHHLEEIDMHLFFLGFALAASPGPDSLLMAKHTLTHGRRYGFLTLAGNRLSLTLHIIFALMGLSVILQQSALLFSIIKTLGALYLIYLGCKSLINFRHKKSQIPRFNKNELTPFKAFQSGFLSNFLNPKVSLFFLSIFPQFTSTDLLANNPVWVAIIFFLGNCCWYVPLIFIIGIHRVRQAITRFQRTLDITFGVFFVLFGLSMIMEEITKAKEKLLETAQSRLGFHP